MMAITTTLLMINTYPATSSCCCFFLFLDSFGILKKERKELFIDQQNAITILLLALGVAQRSCFWGLT